MALVIYILSYLLQLLLVVSLMYYFSKRGLGRVGMHVWQHLDLLKKVPQPPIILCKLFLINPTKLNEKHKYMFLQTGLHISYLYYLLFYRLFFVTTLVGLTTIVITIRHIKYGGWIAAILLILAMVLACERIWLKLWVATRKKKVLYDLYQLSYHLLYFTDSQMNIYGKLQRCLPYTTAVKRDLQLLLLSWTQNSDEALKQFKERLGFNEAISFVDTIQALKLHQDETFYSLLRERIEEYKEQLDIANDSKKETTSYILFVLAGIPILYTFQVFIYPWVKEVQQLLLNMN